MKLTLGEALSIAKELPALLGKDIPIRYALQLSRAIDQINGELRAFETIRTKLIDKYGEKDEDGNLVHEGQQYQIADLAGFNKEYKELVSQEIEISYEPILVEDLGDIKIAASALVGGAGLLLKE